jgi:hypothetical protein
VAAGRAAVFSGSALAVRAVGVLVATAVRLSVVAVAGTTVETSAVVDTADTTWLDNWAAGTI